MRNFACVSHRRTRLGFFLGVIMLNKGANVCWCLISSKAQACGYALQYFPPLVVCQNAKEEGGLIDREGIVVMAHEVIRKNRPELTIEEIPTFGDSYARDYKRRTGCS